MKDKKVKQIITDKLVRNDTGFFVYWDKSIGMKMPFIYGDNEGCLEIIGYDFEKKKVEIKYNEQEYSFHTSNIKNGSALTVIFKEITKEFKIEIGTRLQDDKRDITIIDREIRKEEMFDKKKNKTYIYNEKWYKYKCNKCGWEDAKESWMLEGNLLGHNKGCPVCCTPIKTIVLGINTIWDTDRWMCDLGVSEEDAKTHTYGSTDKIEVTCIDCGRKRMCRVSDIHKYHSISCSCSDKVPFPEKVTFSVLNKLNIDFKYRKTFDWSKNVQVNNPRLCGRKEYDFTFIINNEIYIVETHGMQHYENSFSRMKDSKTLKEEQENDRVKKELSIQNNIKEENYIVIDCRKSDLEFIKQNILNSRLNELFDLSTIDWNKVGEFAYSNLIKKICDIKKNNPNFTATDIAKMMKLSITTICRYLKIGTKMGWCYYNSKYEERYRGKVIPIICITGGQVFVSTNDCVRRSLELYGIKFSANCIHKVCKNKYIHHNSHTFKYIKDLTEEEYIKYDIENKLKELHMERSDL